MTFNEKRNFIILIEKYGYLKEKLGEEYSKELVSIKDDVLCEILEIIDNL